MRFDGIGDNLIQFRTGPAFASEYVVCLCQIDQPGPECVPRLFHGQSITQGLGSDGLDDRQRVLDPVIKLTDQDLPMFVGAPPLGHVACDRRCSDDLALAIFKR
nr:hypothetical protein [Mesorhizobium sp.]